MTERTQPAEDPGLRNYVLTFRAVGGELMAWCIQTNKPGAEIPKLIESAANEWLLSHSGRAFILDEQLSEWGFDYWHALDKIPGEILSKYDLLPATPVYEVVELDPDDNLLPDEFRT